MNRSTSSGVSISAASANGLASPYGLNVQLPSGASWSRLTNCGVVVMTSIGAMPLFSFDVTPRRSREWAYIMFERRGHRAVELLGHVGPCGLLVVSRVEQRPIVVFAEPRQEILRAPLRAPDAEIGLVRDLAVAKELRLVVLRAGVHGINTVSSRERVAGLGAPRLCTGERWERAKAQ